MRISIASAVAAFLLAQPVSAADGYLLRHEFDGGSWDFDMASVAVAADGLRKSQMSLNLSRPLQDRPTGQQYDRVVFVYEHDCSANRMRVVETLTYLAGERVGVPGAAPEWRPAADNIAQRYACALVNPGAD